jgi:hypothetical protein
MNRARHELLADAALSLNQHRRIGRRRSRDRRRHLPERRAVADHLMTHLDRFLQRSVFVAEPALVEGVPETHQHPVAGKWLLDEIERALLGGLDRCADRSMAGHHHHWEGIVDGPDPIEHFEAVHSRHLDVEQHEIGTFAFDQRQSFLTRGCGEKFVSLVLEGHLQRVANGGLVVDDENA